MRQGILKCVCGAGAMALALSACSQAGDQADYEAASYTAETNEGASADASGAIGVEEVASQGNDSGIGVELPDLPVSLPKIAYVYRYGFELPGPNIASLQQKHADLCEARGPYTCRILSMSHGGEDGDHAYGELQLAVAADKAREFGGTLASVAEGLDGEQVAATIEGEDLSKAIVDTEARLRTRAVLRDRLLEVLRTRRGTVAELVEAERGVARVNEEIDQARSWVEEMKTRVAFSRVTVTYSSGTPVTSDFLTPIQGAVGSLGSILGFIVAALIVLSAVALPVGLFAWLGRLLNRRLRLRERMAEA